MSAGLATHEDNEVEHPKRKEKTKKVACLFVSLFNSVKLVVTSKGKIKEYNRDIYHFMMA